MKVERAKNLSWPERNVERAEVKKQRIKVIFKYLKKRFIFFNFLKRQIQEMSIACTNAKAHNTILAYCLHKKCAISGCKAFNIFIECYFM